ncbi:unnamed protein product [Gulo gulo]|uniref:60S ribosomal protein L31 n=1 Tax=Gulo gulo TaxID=48420 RepID=A0A9X9Q0W1_GULGU|nr:unnamed protein product [Gulo gulo]
MAPSKKDGEKEGHSAINNIVTCEYTIDIYKCIQGVGFKKCALWAFREIWKFVMTDMGIPYVYIDIRLNKDVWAEGIRNIPYCICVQLTRKHNKG